MDRAFQCPGMNERIFMFHFASQEDVCVLMYFVGARVLISSSLRVLGCSGALLLLILFFSPMITLCLVIAQNRRIFFDSFSVFFI